MCESFCGGYPLLWVKDEHALEKIESACIRIAELLLKRYSFTFWQRLDESQCLEGCRSQQCIPRVIMLMLDVTCLHSLSRWSE